MAPDADVLSALSRYERDLANGIVPEEIMSAIEKYSKARGGYEPSSDHIICGEDILHGIPPRPPEAEIFVDLATKLYLSSPEGALSNYQKEENRKAIEAFKEKLQPMSP